MFNFRKIFSKLKQSLTGDFPDHKSSPRDFSLSDWKEALLATKDSFQKKDIPILAAGIAYFATFAFFPLMAASVAIASIFISPNNITDVFAAVREYLPADVGGLVRSQLETALTDQSTSFFVALFAIGVSLFSVSGAVQNLIKATNHTYGVEETRGIVELRFVSIKLLFALLGYGIIIILLLLANTSILESIGLPYFAAFSISTLRWFALIAVIGTLIATIYYIGPNKEIRKWQWLTWGSVIATALLLGATILFFVYARYFANLSETYSLFAGIIALMLWFNLSALSVLIGAEINNLLERHLTK